MIELNDVPADEMAELLDMLIWNSPGAGRDQVADWYAELLTRSDRDNAPIRLAIDVCMEYLANPGSPFERRIGERVARGFGSDHAHLCQDN